MKKLSKMIKLPDPRPQNLQNVKYFSDLQIHCAFQRKYPCGIPHRRIVCRPDCYSLEMIRTGEVFLFLDDDKIHLKGPCIFWIGDHHKSFQFEIIAGKSYEHLWIDFTGERGRRIYESLCEGCPEHYIGLKTEKNIFPVFEKIVKKYRVARHPSSSPQDILLLEQLMMELSSQKEEDPVEMNPFGLPFFVEMIKNAPFEKNDPRYFAASAGISYVYFRKKFKEYTGESFRQFTLKQQMLTAGKLLKSGQFRINELADYCNFPDLPSFSRTFKRFYHMSPREYLLEMKTK